MTSSAKLNKFFRDKKILITVDHQGTYLWVTATLPSWAQGVSYWTVQAGRRRTEGLDTNQAYIECLQEVYAKYLEFNPPLPKKAWKQSKEKTDEYNGRIDK